MGSSSRSGSIYLPATPTEATKAGQIEQDPLAGTDWTKAAAALGKLGAPVANAAGAGAAADDSKYLRINAQAAPTDPGGQGLANLLATLMQMHNNAVTAQQPPLQALRPSLLGN